MLQQLETKAPSYCTILDDGTNYNCLDCNGSFHAKDMLYCATPDGKHHICCTECVDKNWLAKAAKINGSV